MSFVSPLRTARICMLAVSALVAATVAFPNTATAQPIDEPNATITVGTSGSTSMRIGEVVSESSHGTRIYCPVSHFAHEDPIVRPGEPSASHLHMFWGNTGADAFSTGESLLNSGRSTCEGGINNRSSYWMPAFFNDQDEVVLPDRLISYYKSFGVLDRSTIQPIPNGLQMLANLDVNQAGPWNFPITEATLDGQPAVSVLVQFPTCLEVDDAGEPVLTSPDNVSHLSYSQVGQPNACPTSHPYRIAGLIYAAHFVVDPNSDWYLASDMGGPKGASLHADYIAAWDETVMADLTRCQIESRDCDMDGGRRQLPERLLGPDGAEVYTLSVTLAPTVDRTPFGTALAPMATSVTPVPPALGDVNCSGTVTIADSVLIAQFIVGVQTGVESCPLANSSSIHVGAADVNGDAQVSIADAVLIAQCTAGLVHDFCAG